MDEESAKRGAGTRTKGNEMGERMRKKDRKGKGGKERKKKRNGTRHEGAFSRQGVNSAALRLPLSVSSSCTATKPLLSTLLRPPILHTTTGLSHGSFLLLVSLFHFSLLSFLLFFWHWYWYTNVSMLLPLPSVLLLYISFKLYARCTGYVKYWLLIIHWILIYLSI